MDNITHSLFGLTLARTRLGRAGRGTAVTLLLASNAPDIDIVATAGGAAKYLEWHRGPTHGPIGVVVLGFAAAVIALLTRPVWDRGNEEPPARFLTLWLIAMLGVVCHVLMDLPTSYGTRPLSPFSWTWFGEDWLPIVDIYLLAILAAPLWYGRSTPTGGLDLLGAHTPRSSRNATIALALMALNYVVHASMHHAAIVSAPEIFGAQLPAPCADAVEPGRVIDRWPEPATAPRDRAAKRCLVEIAAMPDFISPFRWRLIAQLSNAYEVRTVNLLDNLIGEPPAHSDVRLVSIHYPNQWTPVVEKAALTPVAQVFLGFSRFPSARSVIDGDGRATVRWTDLRFVVTDLGAEPRTRPPSLFGATIQFDANGGVTRERLGS